MSALAQFSSMTDVLRLAADSVFKAMPEPSMKGHRIELFISLAMEEAKQRTLEAEKLTAFLTSFINTIESSRG